MSEVSPVPQSVIAAQEAPRPPSRAEVQRARITVGKEGMRVLSQKGVNLGENNGKTPTEIIGSIPGWNNELPIQTVQEAQQLYRELEAAKSKMRGALIRDGKPVDEPAIAAEAEKRVLAGRIRREQDAERKKAKEQTAPGGAGEPVGPESTGVPKPGDSAAGMEVGGETKPDSEAPKSTEKTPAQIAEETRLAAQKAATETWVEEGAFPEAARQVLTELAQEQGFKAAEAAVLKARKERSGEQTPAEAKATEKKIEAAEAVLLQARIELKALRAKNERMKTDPRAKVEDRLLAYDIDLARNAADLSEAEANVDTMKAALLAASGKPAEEQTAAQAHLTAAEAEMTSLTTRKTALEGERKSVGGTPEQQNVNYVEGVVRTLAQSLPKPESEDAAKKQEAAIAEDPIGFLESQMADPANLEAILVNSGISAGEQKKILDTASAEAAVKSVKRKKTKETVTSVGTSGLLAFLLLLYTAYGTNKKSKGGQMG